MTCWCWIYLISIHALREEGDRTGRWRWQAGCYFYPRPPRGGRHYPDVQLFLKKLHFYPRPPRGGRLYLLFRVSKCTQISIHALREEGDSRRAVHPSQQQYFYPRPPRGGRLNKDGVSPILAAFLSTPSARRATTSVPDSRNTLVISIHALREEGDPLSFWLAKLSRIFLSTPSARRATQRPLSLLSAGRISIHALREEGDH